VEATKGENDKCRLHPTMFQWTEERTLTRTRNYYVHLKGKTGVSFPCEVIKYKA
jgi:hypothetical protein